MQTKFMFAFKIREMNWQPHAATQRNFCSKAFNTFPEFQLSASIWEPRSYFILAPDERERPGSLETDL